jgi:hypothetical protein
MERYIAMYPRGQSGLPDDPVTAYMNDLRAICVASGSATTLRALSMRLRDTTRECFVCVASASSSSDLEPSPCHCATNAQRSARLDELAEARCQLDEGLANLHRELREDPDLATGSPRRCQPHSWSRCRRNAVRETACGRSVVLPLSSPEPAPPRCWLEDACTTMTANEGANVNANADGDALSLFRRVSQNLAATAMLLRGCPEKATSEELRVCQQLNTLLEAAAAQQAESSASLQRSEHGRAVVPSAHGPNPPPSRH